MQVIANRPIYGKYGMKSPDEQFDVDDDTANELLARGYVRHARPPRVQYEVKVITPEAPEVSAREPFRDSSMPDQEPATMDSEGNKLLSSATIFESGDAHPRGRRRRSGSDSGE